MLHSSTDWAGGGVAADKMMTIEGNSIELGPLPFDIHMEDNRGKLVLWGRKGMTITAELKQTIDRGNRVFMISGLELESYLDYALENMQKMVRDPSVPTRIKTSVISDVGQKIFDKIEAESFHTTVAEYTRSFTQSVVRLILTTPAAYHDLLTLATQQSYLFDHAINTCTFCIVTGRHIVGEDELLLYQVGLGGLLMNLGMISVPAEIQQKNGPLSDAEWAEVKKHPMAGYQMLLLQGMPQRTMEMARWHHERMDGSGYPDGLRGEQIPEHVQIAAVCDVYDALTSIRSYRKQLNPLKAIQELMREHQKYSLAALGQLMHTVLENESLVTSLMKRLI